MRNQFFLVKINNKISEPFISPPRHSRKLEVKTACIEVHHLTYKEESLAACGGACFLNTEMGKKGMSINQTVGYFLRHCSSYFLSPQIEMGRKLRSTFCRSKGLISKSSSLGPTRNLMQVNFGVSFPRAVFFSILCYGRAEAAYEAGGTRCW